jgi:hypothetical protein
LEGFDVDAGDDVVVFAAEDVVVFAAEDVVDAGDDGDDVVEPGDDVDDAGDDVVDADDAGVGGGVGGGGGGTQVLFWYIQGDVVLGTHIAQFAAERRGEQRIWLGELQVVVQKPDPVLFWQYKQVAVDTQTDCEKPAQKSNVTAVMSPGNPAPAELCGVIL